MINCKKKSFDTKLQAIQKVETIRLRDTTSSKKPIRGYQCSKCGFWHLTSMSKKKQILVQERRSPIRRYEKEAEYFTTKNNW
jgi:hypothetical protein